MTQPDQTPQAEATPDQPAPVVKTTSGAVQGFWRGPSAAFLGIPFAQPPVGELRFAAPEPVTPWEGVRDATQFGATPQRRPFGEVTTIPEPSFPGESTLNVNVFTPRPGDPDAKLPVFVWIHGGGFFAGSPSSPWYDGRSFNRDDIVTVSISYRLGFDGFGWIADAPTNRGLLDQIAGLEWVRDNIAAFGGNPDRVTIGGQSAGGSSVMAMVCSPKARGLFAGAIAHSGAGLLRPLASAEQIGRDLAREAGVEPTRAGWSTKTEDEILDLQTAAMPRPDAPDPVAMVRSSLGRGSINLPFIPVVGDDVLPEDFLSALRHGAGDHVALMCGTVAHEFSAMGDELREAWADLDPLDVLTRGGMPADAAKLYLGRQPELTTVADVVGQLSTDRSFRIPTIEWAERHDRVWVYDFRWVSPVNGLAFHCLELPFAWDLLDAEGVDRVAPGAPQELADEMHAVWVKFIATGQPGWGAWNGSNPRVFGGEQADTYRASRILRDVVEDRI